MALEAEHLTAILASLGQDCTIIAHAVVKLHLASPDPAAVSLANPDSILSQYPEINNQVWTDAEVIGGLVLVQDAREGSLLFQIYSFVEKDMLLFEYELYENFDYSRLAKNFYCFEMDDCVAGMAFTDSKIAHNFYLKVVEHTPKPPEPLINNQSSEPEVFPNIQLKKGKKSKSSGRARGGSFKFGKMFGRKKKHKYEDIGEVDTVEHKRHIGVDDRGNFNFKNLPKEWKDFFKEAGIKKKDLQDPEIAREMLETIQTAEMNIAYGNQLEENESQPVYTAEQRVAFERYQQEMMRYNENLQEGRGASFRQMDMNSEVKSTVSSVKPSTATYDAERRSKISNNPPEKPPRTGERRASAFSSILRDNVGGAKSTYEKTRIPPEMPQRVTKVYEGKESTPSGIGVQQPKSIYERSRAGSKKTVPDMPPRKGSKQKEGSSIVYEKKPATKTYERKGSANSSVPPQKPRRPKNNETEETSNFSLKMIGVAQPEGDRKKSGFSFLSDGGQKKSTAGEESIDDMFQSVKKNVRRKSVMKEIDLPRKLKEPKQADPPKINDEGAGEAVNPLVDSIDDLFQSVKKAQRKAMTEVPWRKPICASMMRFKNLEKYEERQAPVIEVQEKVVEVVRYEESAEFSRIKAEMEKFKEEAREAKRKAEELEKAKQDLLESKRLRDIEYKRELEAKKEEVAQLKNINEELKLAKEKEEFEKEALRKAKEKADEAKKELERRNHKTQEEREEALRKMRERELAVEQARANLNATKAKLDEAESLKKALEQQKKKEHEAHLLELEAQNKKLAEVKEAAEELKRQKAREEVAKVALSKAKQRADEEQLKLKAQNEATRAEKFAALKKIKEKEDEMKKARENLEMTNKKLLEAEERAKKLPPPPPSLKKLPKLPPLQKAGKAPAPPPLPPLPPPPPPVLKKPKVVKKEAPKKVLPKGALGGVVLDGITKGVRLVPVQKPKKGKKQEKRGMIAELQRKQRQKALTNQKSNRKSVLKAFSMRLNRLSVNVLGDKKKANVLMSNLQQQMMLRRANIKGRIVTGDDSDESDWSE